MANTGYSSVPAAEEGGGDANAADYPSDRRKSVILGVCVAAALALVACGIAIGRTWEPRTPLASVTAGPGGKTRLPVPAGVNLGSWLSLEDYFYVGTDGAIEVATPESAAPAALCLPPMHTGPSTGPRWSSETDLFSNLTAARGLREAIKIFHSFRASYLDWDEELGQMARAGIKRVRVPVSWCLTDFDPTDDEVLGRDDGDDESDDDDDELERRFVCRDPFFDDDAVLWPAVPRPFLVRFLRSCSRHGLRATLDVHTYPGGTSLGTFSGVWPRSPLFWLHDDPENPADDVGRTLYRGLLEWIGSLAESDPDALSGLGAVTPMNEPAHLAGLFGGGGPWEGRESFLPSLSEETEGTYLSEMRGDDAAGTPPPAAPESAVPIPAGSHLRVLLWQRDAVEYFRSSSLPSMGIELHVNVHESILAPVFVPDDGDDGGGRHPHGTAILTSWWRTATTVEERATWAVLDMHHYHAWEPDCQGASDGVAGSYACGDAGGTDDVLGRCASWADMYRETADEQMMGATTPPSSRRRPKLASAEFSASTHHTVLESCLDVTTLRKTYLAQVEAAERSHVDLYWWSWKMPHGGTFRRAWSFKHFLHLMGVEGFEDPDESEIPCG